MKDCHPCNPCPIREPELFVSRERAASVAVVLTLLCVAAPLAVMSAVALWIRWVWR